MPEEDKIKKIVKDGKILIGDDKLVCFACGEEVDAQTEICPYCDTVLK